MSASAAAAIAAAHAAIGLGVASSASSAAPRRSTSSAKRPARSIAPLSTSSSGSTPPNSRCSSSVIATPSSTRSRPARQVPLGERVELERRAVGGVEAPADPAVGDPVLHAREVVVVEAEAPADGLAVGEVEHLRGGQPLLGEVEQLRDDAEHRVGLAQRAVGEPDAQVGRADVGRQRRRARRRRAISPAPKVAWISGANVSMSGHMTMTSRGSSVGSSCEQVQDRVAQDLDLAGAAVAGVDLDAAVVRVEQRARVVVAGERRARRRAVGADVGLDAREQRAGAVRRPAWWWSTCSSRSREDELHLAGVVAPRGQQPVGGEVAVGSSPRRTIGGRPPSSARRASHSAGDGCSRKRWTSRWAASARSTCRWPAGRRVRPNSETRCGQLDQRGSSRSRAHASSSRSAGLGRADPRPQAPPELGLPARVRAAAAAGAVDVLPVAQARTISGRWRA